MKRKKLKFNDSYNDIVINELSEIYEVKKDEIFSGSRKRNLISAKRMYIFLLREVFGLTVMKIGEVTNLHHATIIYHARQFKFFFKTYSEDSNSFKRVESVIDIETFERIESRVLEVEIDEEISKLEGISERITDSLTKLYKIKKQKNDRQEREGLLTK